MIKNNTTDCILAIEVIGRGGSVALLSSGRTIAWTELSEDGVSHHPAAAKSPTPGSAPMTSRSASLLVPSIARLINENLDSNAVPACIAVAQGPGSFTGLRVALTTAKSLAYAWSVPIIGVDSLAAIAETIRTSDVFETGDPPANFVIGLSAYRNQVYRMIQVAGDVSNHDPPEPAEEVGQSRHTDIVSMSQWKTELRDLFEQTDSPSRKIVCGGDRSVFEKGGIQPPTESLATESLATKSLATKSFAAATVGWAVGVGRIAQRKLERGETENPITLVPNYLRPSAAEE